jgi:hypothetical protein
MVLAQSLGWIASLLTFLALDRARVLELLQEPSCFITLSLECGFYPVPVAPQANPASPAVLNLYFMALVMVYQGSALPSPYIPARIGQGFTAIPVISRSAIKHGIFSNSVDCGISRDWSLWPIKGLVG